MNRRSALRMMMAAGAGSAFSSLFADAPADAQDNYILRSEVRLVLLDVSVESRDGGFVSGLTKENFKVFEDNRPQPITVFAHNDLPVTIGILVDESRSMSPKRSAVLTAALTFIAESNPADQLFVLNFNDTVQRGLPGAQLFSDDREELRLALFSGISQGRTALFDAVVEGLKQLELGQRDKKALVLLSDGGDNASLHTRRQALERIERSPATIYTVGLFDTDDPDRDPNILRELARISGGRVYFPQGVAEMVPVCRRIAHDIRSRYTLGYLPPMGKGPRSLRNIRVEASAPGHSAMTARTRTSYRYDTLPEGTEQPGAGQKGTEENATQPNGTPN
jgi:Ca-activated chloride channel homolog